jgi:hypothetical protein
MTLAHALNLDAPNKHSAVIFDEVQDFIQVTCWSTVANDGFANPFALQLSIDKRVALEVILGHLREKFDFFDFVGGHFRKD